MREWDVMAAATILAVGFMTPTALAAEPALASCPIHLPARAGRAAQDLRTLDVLVGSADGSEGRISARSDAEDKSGKHWRDVYALADARPVFLACHYAKGAVVTVQVPTGATSCELDYHYVSDYDTRPDRAFCR